MSFSGEGEKNEVEEARKALGRWRQDESDKIESLFNRIFKLAMNYEEGTEQRKKLFEIRGVLTEVFDTVRLGDKESEIDQAARVLGLCLDLIEDALNILSGENKTILTNISEEIKVIEKELNDTKKQFSIGVPLTY